MRSHWMIGVALGALVVAGCGTGGGQNEQNLEQNQASAPGTGLGAADQVNPPTPNAPPPSTASRADGSATGTRPSVQSSPRKAPADRPAVSAAPAAAPRAQWREVTLPAGTSLPLELTTSLSSETAAVETPVQARLRQAVTVDGETVLPAGTVFIGHVTDVERSGRVQGRAHITLSFTEARVNGGREDIRTDPLTFQAEATKGEDATKVGVGAGAGAIIGGILGGGKGAATGAAIGGAAGSGVVLATRGKDVTVPSGTSLAASLATPVALRVAVR